MIFNLHSSSEKDMHTTYNDTYKITGMKLKIVHLLLMMKWGDYIGTK